MTDDYHDCALLNGGDGFTCSECCDCDDCMFERWEKRRGRDETPRCICPDDLIGYLGGCSAHEGEPT